MGIEAAISLQAGVRSNHKAVFRVTLCLRNNAAQAFRHSICDGVGHRMVLAGLVLLDRFRSADRQCSEVLRGLDDGNRTAAAIHIGGGEGKAHIAISISINVSHISANWSIERSRLTIIPRFLSQNIDRQFRIQCEAANRQRSSAVTLYPESGKRICPTLIISRCIFQSGIAVSACVAKFDVQTVLRGDDGLGILCHGHKAALQIKVIGDVNMTHVHLRRYILNKRNALRPACVQLHGRRSILNIDPGFTACCGGVARHLAAVHYELGASLVHLYRAKGAAVTDDFAAVHGERTVTLLHLHGRPIFDAAVDIVADLTARLQRHVGRVAVGDNIKCRGIYAGRRVIVIDLAING